MKATDVFSAAIMCLKEHLENELKKTGVSQEEEDNIRWVLTLPAIWGDDAKQFMRDAAVEVNSPNINNPFVIYFLFLFFIIMFLCLEVFLSHSRIFHSFVNVTIPGEGF